MLDEWEQDLIEELKDPEFARMYGEDRAKSTFGMALLKARRAANMTQAEFAEKLGVRQPYIAQLESGEANPTLGAAGRMLAALGLKMVISLEPLAPQEKPVNKPGFEVKSGARRIKNSKITVISGHSPGRTSGQGWNSSGIHSGHGQHNAETSEIEVKNKQ